MKILCKIGVLQNLCKATGRFGMYISWANDLPYDEVMKAAPYLNYEDHGQILTEMGGVLLFDDADEMERYFNMTVGDDGPTASNSYNGECKIYAITCNSCGDLLTENT